MKLGNVRILRERCFGRPVVVAAGLAGLMVAGGWSAWAGAPNAEPKDGAWVSYMDGKEVPMPEIGRALGDPETIAKILDEGKNRNKVMGHLRHLSNEIGPRLTGSARQQKASEWAREQFISFGYADARLEQWGTIPYAFDRGPSSVKLFAKPKLEGKKEEKPAGEGAGEKSDKPEKEEALRVMEFTTPAWTRGTDGPVRGRVIKEPTTDAEFEAVRELIPGSWIALRAQAPVAQRGVRSIVSARINAREGLLKKSEAGEVPADASIMDRVTLLKPAGYVSASRDERVWTGPLSNWKELTIETLPRTIEVVVARPDYDALNSRLYDGEELELEVNLDHKLSTMDGGVPVYNTVAEIRGTEWPEQVVIVSGHLDSWDGPGSQGTTDNGTGSSVTLEAARILAAVGAKPKRTIRFVLWSGEEQGLLGSAAYTKLHEADLPNISAVFVDDGGTNYQGGLECIAPMAELLAAATAPVNNQFFEVKTDASGVATKSALNVNIRTQKRMPRGGGSDHASFNAKGVPGFFWDEEGRAIYGRGWHTQFDRIDLAVPEYLEQSSTCSAITAYRLACAETLLAREPAEEPKKAEESPGAGGAKEQPEAKPAEEKRGGEVPAPAPAQAPGKGTR